MSTSRELGKFELIAGFGEAIAGGRATESIRSIDDNKSTLTDTIALHRAEIELGRIRWINSEL